MNQGTSRSTKFSSNEHLKRFTSDDQKYREERRRLFEVLRLEEFDDNTLTRFIERRGVGISLTDDADQVDTAIIELCKIPAYGETLKNANEGFDRYENEIQKANKSGLVKLIKFECLLYQTALSHNVKRSKALVNVGDGITFGVAQRDRLLANLAMNIFENKKKNIETGQIYDEFRLIYLVQKLDSQQENLESGCFDDLASSNFKVLVKDVIDNAVNDIRSQSLFEFEGANKLRFIKDSVFCYYVAKKIFRLLVGSEVEVARALRSIGKLDGENESLKLIFHFLELFFECGVNELDVKTSNVLFVKLVRNRCEIDKELSLKVIQKALFNFDVDFNASVKSVIYSNLQKLFRWDTPIFKKSEESSKAVYDVIQLNSGFEKVLSSSNSEMVCLQKEASKYSNNNLSLLVSPYTTTNKDFISYLEDTEFTLRMDDIGVVWFDESNMGHENHQRSWKGAHSGAERGSLQNKFNSISNHYHLFHMAPGVMESKDKEEMNEFLEEPVRWISFLDCALYCNWLSIKMKTVACYTIQITDEKVIIQLENKANGFRLPTETEWRRIASADSSIDIGSPYFEELSSSNSLESRTEAFLKRNDLLSSGNFEDISNVRSVRTTHSNEYGIFGMYGNIREWTQPDLNTIEPSITEGAIIGCSSTLGDESLKYNFEASKISLTSTNHDVGFRVVRNIPINS